MLWRFFFHPAYTCRMVSGQHPSAKFGEWYDDSWWNSQERVCEPFIGPADEQPRPSFRVARDVYEGYMLLVWPSDEEINAKPVWVALALSDPMLSSSSERFQQIRVQYFMPKSKMRVVLETYANWNTKKNMKWKVASNKPPCWIHTSCILTAWKKRSNAGSICIPPL
jgi:hypothetical protein